MKYYTKKPKYYKRPNLKYNRFQYWFLIIVMIILLFNIILYLFNKRILPSVLSIGEVKMKSEAVKIINEESVKVFSDDFNYEDIINIEKDSEGNIVMLRADTVRQNYLASQVVLNCNDKLKELGELGVKIPIGYLTNNVMFYTLGPKITVKMQQVGNIETSYESIFESAGINQTRHKIYLNVEARVRMKIPLHSKEQVVTCQIPVAETIIVGKTPNTAIDLGGGNK